MFPSSKIIRLVGINLGLHQVAMNIMSNIIRDLYKLIKLWAANQIWDPLSHKPYFKYDTTEEGKNKPVLQYRGHPAYISKCYGK